MSIILEICGSGSSQTKNTGADSQCLEGMTVGYALSKNPLVFPTIANLKTLEDWKTAITAKDVVIAYSVEANLENVVTEPTYYESRSLKIKTKDGKVGKKFTHHLSLCSHSALSSFEDSEYIYVYEFTEDGYIKAINGGNAIEGLKLSNFLVSPRKDAVDGTPASTDVEFVYADFKSFENDGVIVKPDFAIEDLKGIFEVGFEVVGTPTATEIVVKATSGCKRKAVTSLALADFLLKDASGATQTITAVTAVDNVYTLAGAGLVSGTLATNNVIVQTNISYEASQVVIKI